jgi:hypothetical protein
MKALTKCAPLLVVVGFGTAIRADSEPPSDPKKSETTVQVEVKATMTVVEMQSGAAQVQLQLREDYRHVFHYTEVVRKSKDVIKLNCLNDYLLQIKAQMNIADVTKQQLEMELAKSSSDERVSMYTQLVEIGGKVKRLREQANACMGETELSSTSGVAVNNPYFPDDPTADNPFDDKNAIEVEPPAYASLFF